MTINIFLAIFASVLFFTGATGCVMTDFKDGDGTFAAGIVFIICSILAFILSFMSPSNYELHLYHWLIFICPLVYIIILIWEFFTEKYIVPWKRDYYKEYKTIKNNYDTLWKEYNKLQKDFENLKQSYQKDIKDIPNKQSTENNNNFKLYF